MIGGYKMKKGKKKISIIVPVWNTSKYLKRCLDSILTAIDDNCEVIIINDGSTDDSEKVIKKFIDDLSDNQKKQFSYYYKENKGLADTKNLGLSKATGEYISFIDSDDYISSDFYSVARKYIDQDYDMIIYDLYVIFEKKVYPNYVARAISEQEDSLKIQALNGEMQGSSCNKIIKKSLYQYEFPVGKEYEDVAVTPFIIEDAKKIKYLPYAMYYYLQRKNSIVSNNTLTGAFYKICQNIQCVLNSKEKAKKYEYIIVTFFLKRTISSLELEYKKNKKDFVKNIEILYHDCNLIIKYILEENLVNKYELELTSNQKFLLVKIYTYLLNGETKKVKRIFMARSIFNRLRSIKNAIVMFGKNIMGG